MSELNSQISIAVSKGRIVLEALPLLVRAGLSPVEDMKTSRKLLIETVNPDVKLVVVSKRGCSNLCEAWRCRFWNCRKGHAP